MQFEFIFKPAKHPPADGVIVNGRQIPVEFVRAARARRYVLRLRRDGSLRVTIPRGGSLKQARRFAEQQTTWVARQLERLAAQPTPTREWLIGTEIFLRGEKVKIEAGTNGESGTIRFGSEAIRAIDPTADLRPAIEQHLWSLAVAELLPRVLELAALQAQTVRRVTIRNQRSRWGSCSRRGTISLNWRLIQAPAFVRDYLILHELSHLKEMNHSIRFWREVKRVCPDFEVAERWLKQHVSLLN